MIKSLTLLSLCIPLTLSSLRAEEASAEKPQRQVAEAYGTIDD